MLVGQLRQAVEVAVNALLEQGQHENVPQLHAGTAPRRVELGRWLLARVAAGVGRLQQVLLEQVEDALTQPAVAVDVLDALQHGGDIVAAAGVDLDVLDGDLAEGGLEVMDDSHG